MTEIASRAQLRMAFLRYALVTVPLVLLLGTLSGRASNSGYSNPWFAALVKPEAMPPGWVFGAAWTLLYILMGLALALVLQARGARRRRLAVFLFAAQLVVNLAWSPTFFAGHAVTTAFFLILAMLGLATAATLEFWRIRRAAGLLMIPYLLWLAFAGYLTYRIDRLNPDAETLVPRAGSADIAL